MAKKDEVRKLRKERERYRRELRKSLDKTLDGSRCERLYC